MGCSTSKVQKKIPTFKVVLLGDSGCGKTCVYLRYAKNQFDYGHMPTTSVEISHIVRKLEQPLNMLASLTVWDLPSQEDFDLRQIYYEDVDAAIVVLDVTQSQNEFDRAALWREDVLGGGIGSDPLQRGAIPVPIIPTDDTEKLAAAAAARDSIPPSEPGSLATLTSPPPPPPRKRSIPVIVLGNKADLLANMEERHAALARLKDLAETNGFTDFALVSAMRGEGVYKAFKELLTDLVEEWRPKKGAEGVLQIGLAAALAQSDSLVAPKKKMSSSPTE